MKLRAWLLMGAVVVLTTDEQPLQFELSTFPSAARKIA